MRSKDIEAIRDIALKRFQLRINGIHGIRHWERVRENAVYLARHNDADVFVCETFAYIHDCCRGTDRNDPDHGERAAAFAETLRGDFLTLSDQSFELLRFACAHHEKGQLSENPTIGACWDADRLDLGRVWKRPKEKYLSTAQAKLESVREWAYKRGRGQKATIDA